MKTGQRVRIKESVFPGFSDQCDIFARGKTGVVVYDLGDGLFEVRLDEPMADDIGIYPLLESEIEAAK